MLRQFYCRRGLLVSRVVQRTSTGKRGFRRFTSSSLDQVYLHVGPSGDCWTGSSLFAAKHLEPEYVTSIPLPPDTCLDTLMEALEEEDNVKLMQQVYDTGVLPPHLLKAATSNDHHVNNGAEK